MNLPRVAMVFPANDSASAGISDSGYSSRREDQTEKEARDKSAQMRGHADLRSGEIERDLDRNDHHNI